MNKESLKKPSRMKRVILMIVCLLLVSQVWAQYKISKHSVNNGGGISAGPSYRITASIGQKEAFNSSSGGGFNVTGGFWSAGIDGDLIFKNSFEQ